jgi:dienelactone hydrolase
MDVIEGTTKPVCLLWGDKDTMAPPELLEAYRGLAAKKKNLELHIFPGILHSYMMPGSTGAYDQAKRDFTMKRSLEILAGLRG